MRKVKLTKRQEEVFSVLITGATYDVIAAQIGIKKSTVRGHLRRIYRKVDAHTAVDAFRKIMRLGIFPSS